MAALKKDVLTDTTSAVRIVYLDQAISRNWNAKRDADDLPTFCGWYWIHKDGAEAGPFRTYSSAARDAYYRFVIKRDLPRTPLQRMTRVKLKAVA